MHPARPAPGAAVGVVMLLAVAGAAAGRGVGGDDGSRGQGGRETTSSQEGSGWPSLFDSKMGCC